MDWEGLRGWRTREGKLRLVSEREGGQGWSGGRGGGNQEAEVEGTGKSILRSSEVISVTFLLTFVTNLCNLMLLSGGREADNEREAEQPFFLPWSSAAALPS